MGGLQLFLGLPQSALLFEEAAGQLLRLAQLQLLPVHQRQQVLHGKGGDSLAMSDEGTGIVMKGCHRAQLQGALLLCRQEPLQLLCMQLQSSLLVHPDLLLGRPGRIPLLQRRDRLQQDKRTGEEMDIYGRTDGERDVALT